MDIEGPVPRSSKGVSEWVSKYLFMYLEGEKSENWLINASVSHNWVRL